MTADSTVNVDRNHTLNAKWRENTYTVSFNTNGGSSVGSISVKYGDTYGTLPTTQKDYYTFTGWYTSPSGGTKVSSGDTFNSTSNITLYAQWKENGLSDWVLESEKPANADVFTASGHMMKRHIKLRQVIQRLKDIKTTDTVSIRIQPTNGESTESGVTTRRINRKRSLDTVK